MAVMAMPDRTECVCVEEERRREREPLSILFSPSLCAHMFWGTCFLCCGCNGVCFSTKTTVSVCQKDLWLCAVGERGAVLGRAADRCCTDGLSEGTGASR